MFLIARGDGCWAGGDSWEASSVLLKWGEHRVSPSQELPPGAPLQHLTSGGRTKWRTRAWAGSSSVMRGCWIKRSDWDSACTRRIETDCLLLMEDLLTQDGVGQTGGTPQMAAGQHWARGPECPAITAWCFSFLRDLALQRIPGWALRPLWNAPFGMSRIEGYFSKMFTFHLNQLLCDVSSFFSYVIEVCLS